ncbi:unnamed protein product [Paramecium pentaurelia]|uniref:Uncharacterized protein n=1 Tax=Paramecium pentaurelia TaxID=43138 RepID=A0A8S1XM34_9CILI|nr:unnamed protein product [Paramecium pentaurelia]
MSYFKKSKPFWILIILMIKYQFIKQLKYIKDQFKIIILFQEFHKNFYFAIQHADTKSTITPTSLQAELKQIIGVVQKMIIKSTNFDVQINQDVVFLDERLYQKKDAILDSLLVMKLLIDVIFLKIPKAIVSFQQDEEQIINVAEGLINLIEKIAMLVNVKAKVNGPQLIVNGQILKWQLSKITKVILNNQFDIDRDLLDGLIDLVQKEQIELNYNYFNPSQELQTKLQTFFNFTTLEIDEYKYKKTNLQYHLYKDRYIEYEDTIKQYMIDMFKTPY